MKIFVHATFSVKRKNFCRSNKKLIELQGKWATLGGWAAKSHIVTNHPIFDGLPTNIIASGVYENVHPKSSMSKIEGDYIAGMIGYDHFPNNDIMVRHYILSWNNKILCEPKRQSGDLPEAENSTSASLFSNSPSV